MPEKWLTVGERSCTTLHKEQRRQREAGRCPTVAPPMPKSVTVKEEESLVNNKV